MDEGIRTREGLPRVDSFELVVGAIGARQHISMRHMATTGQKIGMKGIVRTQQAPAAIE